jgi:hypothetical protein
MRALVLSVIALIALATATWQAQARLNDLRLLHTHTDNARTQATVQEVRREPLKKGESRAEKQAQVLYVFSVNGQDYRGAFLTDDNTATPNMGDRFEVVYAVNKPSVYLRAEEFADLPRHIRGMQWIMGLLGLATLFVPFMIAGFGRRKTRPHHPTEGEE